MAPSEPLPFFKYHPDPVATGTVKISESACICCGRQRGYIYTRPVYAIEEYADQICPWCIADGSAHRKLDVTFVCEWDIGLRGTWDDKVPEAVIEEISQRTPGFMGWEQDRWWTHCGDAAQFVAKVGHDELVAAGPEAIEAVRAGTGVNPGVWEELFEAATRDGSPRAYLFKCPKCGKYGGYIDCD
ncbi:MAG TPA: CbrC family protein [Tepidisphaeraceae bacterium]|jgi:hypothetical protein|nr:CbrC family protein [Tepidisphaeraceae bacterium]